MRHRLLTSAATAALTGICSLTACTPAPSTGSALPVFSEDFRSQPVNSTWKDGEQHGAWLDVYNGYGTQKVVVDGSPVLEQSPKASTRRAETHASLATTTTSYGSVDLTVRQRTVTQLRTPTPNPWEVPWLLWNYTDDDHFYSVVLKPNGWELGKEDPAYPGAQRYLATGSNVTFAVGVWHTVRVKQVGSTITVWGDGKQLASVTDQQRPYGSGRIGLYTEDARVQHDDLVVSVPVGG